MVQLLRERNGEHTCDELRPHQQSYLRARFDGWNVDDIPNDDEDKSWNPHVRETFAEQQVRSAKMLQKIAEMPEKIIYIASHSGTIATMLAALAYGPCELGPGGTIFVYPSMSLELYLTTLRHGADRRENDKQGGDAKEVRK